MVKAICKPHGVPQKSSSGIRKPRPSRGKGLRATTGCITCRKRHVKCDEIQPNCSPCTKSGRDCVYVAAASSPQRSIGPNPPFSQVRQPTASRTYEGVDNAIAYDDDDDAAASRSTVDPSLGKLNLQAFDRAGSLRIRQHDESDVVPLDWWDSLTKDVSQSSLDTTTRLEALSEAALTHGHLRKAERAPVEDTDSDVLQDQSHTARASSRPLPNYTPSRLSSSELQDERDLWQSTEPYALKDWQIAAFLRSVSIASNWIDLFDPHRHFSTLIPHLALRNKGLMAALIALGARFTTPELHDPPFIFSNGEQPTGYYRETLQYLQSATMFESYRDSPELLATTLILSTYGMIDGRDSGGERHLKAMYWIQRTRGIHGESANDLERSVWWAWLRQDVWVAFRERRKVYSSAEPRKPYHLLDPWELAARVTYLLAQAVDYCSDEGRERGEEDLNLRVKDATALLRKLDMWQTSLTVHFERLPTPSQAGRAFAPIRISPPFCSSIQMFNMARLLILSHQPLASGYLGCAEREEAIMDAINNIAGIALDLTDDASRPVSLQCMFAAKLYCTDDSKRLDIVQSMKSHLAETAWPCGADLVEGTRDAGATRLG